jgi:hypothetical protein
MSRREPAERFAVMTTPLLMRDLKEIDRLIATLRRGPVMDPGDIEDLSWLQSRRRYILALLAARRAQKGRKIVRLDLWRDGGLRVTGSARQVA